MQEGHRIELHDSHGIIRNGDTYTESKNRIDPEEHFAMNTQVHLQKILEGRHPETILH